MSAIDLSPILTPLLQLAGLGLTGAVAWLVKRGADYFHVAKDSNLRTRLEAIADNGIALALHKATTAATNMTPIPTSNAALATAMNYVISKAPGTLKALGVDISTGAGQQHVLDIVSARMGAATVSPPVSAPAFASLSDQTVFPVPLAPVAPPPAPAEKPISQMDARSETNLAHVHPDLVRIIRAALQIPQPFEVTYGLRTLEAEAQAVASGHSQTMHSRHLPNANGFACAVDVTPLDHGVLSFEPGHEAYFYGAIAIQIKAAASELGIPIEWGGDWHSFKDWGHFQLPWALYP